VDRVSGVGVVSFLVVLSAGCSGTIPVNYTPQNFIRLKGRVSIGRFTYKPSEPTPGPCRDLECKDTPLAPEVEPNQIQNTAIGRIYIATDVASLVQRATALELEKTGFELQDTYPLSVSGDVLEFKAADLGYSVDWTYAIRYRIEKKGSAKPLFERVYRADPRTTGKFGIPSDLAPSVNELILSAYNKFMNDPETRTILLGRAPSSRPAPQTQPAPAAR